MIFFPRWASTVAHFASSQKSLFFPHVSKGPFETNLLRQSVNTELLKKIAEELVRPPPLPSPLPPSLPLIPHPSSGPQDQIKPHERRHCTSNFPRCRQARLDCLPRSSTRYPASRLIFLLSSHFPFHDSLLSHPPSSSMRRCC